MKHLLVAIFLVSIIGLIIGNDNGVFTFIFCWSGGFLVPLIVTKVSSLKKSTSPSVLNLEK